MRELERPLPSLSYVVARSRGSNVIGCDNQLPWRLGTDLRYFKKTTSEHVVIMGRKTLESIGRPLPNRVNIVLSREKLDNYGDKVVWASTQEDALFLADHYSIKLGRDEAFVVGGERVYSIFEPFFNKIHLTEVDCPSVVGDSHFKYKFNHKQWAVIARYDFSESEVDQYPFAITVMERRRKFVRMINLSDYYVECDEFDNWKRGRASNISRRPVRSEIEQFSLSLVG